ncbi:MAG TPA: phosphodiester glycosidase family protein [Methylomusa anaerophila]|uniref:Exopolysaccharide biosynthesis protein n=1 Tax=Methylomusa anaerophila TaxID=1930071 RepID=A0A348AKE5_9FIRM|nr:phosphodiester glycosidase family protein [Methylomusa anaerophila]BBB91543.1 exopolysaccharide biosynthesis protein [Methylomusa anaerophila]HML89519.1 phosphodiester glycosidase family protein [Methylomusa anaerophila]
MKGFRNLTAFHSARRWGFFLALILCLLAVPAQAWADPGSIITKIRSSQSAERVRIVFEFNNIPQYKVTTLENPLRLVLNLSGSVNQAGLSQITFNDPIVSKLRLFAAGAGKLQAVVDLKSTYMYNVFTIKNPDRLIVDIIKNYDQKLVEEVTPGIKHISWQRSTGDGPVWAHALDVDPQAGYLIKPVLSNGIVQGLETLVPMSQRARAIAAVNGSYFAPDGTIIGLLKMDGQIVSTPELPRTAFGILPDGKIIIDQVDYEGKVELPDGRTIPLSAVNRERGPDELILYNSFYDATTRSNPYGIEVTIINGKIAAINDNNSPIPPDGAVLSAHGAAAKIMSGLKIGDEVKISQTLGTVWDKITWALSAGPMLVKDNSVFLTTKIEEFGPDVAGGRAPRTALGITADGHILLVVVDGRQSTSIGMTLLETALFMQELGATDAMNLDGGGSSEMVIRDTVVNKPSDGQERKLGSAVVVIPGRIAN